MKDADALALKAQEEQSMTILERSNDLRKLAKSKKEEVDECTCMEQSLILRRDSIV